MNSYYITTRQTFEENVHCFHPTLSAHYIDLDNGKILLSAHFLHPTYLSTWESQKDVQKLPEAETQGTKPLHEKLVQQLAPLGVIAGHTVLDVAEIAQNRNSFMRLRSF